MSKKKYRVHGYHVVRVPLTVEANSQEEAIREYDKLTHDELRHVQDLARLDSEFAEEVNGYLVDEDGDEDYDRSEFYCCDGKTPASNRCTQCLRSYSCPECKQTGFHKLSCDTGRNRG